MNVPTAPSPDIQGPPHRELFTFPSDASPHGQAGVDVIPNSRAIHTGEFDTRAMQTAIVEAGQQFTQYDARRQEAERAAAIKAEFARTAEPAPLVEQFDARTMMQNIKKARPAETDFKTEYQTPDTPPPPPAPGTAHARYGVGYSDKISLPPPPAEALKPARQPHLLRRKVGKFATGLASHAVSAGHRVHRVATRAEQKEHTQAISVTQGQLAEASAARKDRISEVQAATLKAQKSAVRRGIGDLNKSSRVGTHRTA